MNREFKYLGETYQLKDKLDDIVLDIKEQDDNLIVNLRKTSYYKRIVEGIYFNEKNNHTSHDTSFVTFRKKQPYKRFFIYK